MLTKKGPFVLVSIFYFIFCWNANKVFPLWMYYTLQVLVLPVLVFGVCYQLNQAYHHIPTLHNLLHHHKFIFLVNNICTRENKLLTNVYWIFEILVYGRVETGTAIYVWSTPNLCQEFDVFKSLKLPLFKNRINILYKLIGLSKKFLKL